MKHLCLHTETYRVILSEFANYVQARGFSYPTSDLAPAAIQEFLYNLEQKQVYAVGYIEPKHVLAHYDHLSCRRNDRKPELGLSASMIGHHLYALRLFFEWLERLGALKLNPMTCLEFPRLHGSKRLPLSLEDIQQLYDACDTHLERALLGLFYGCALRRNEAHMLDIRDVNWSAAKVIVRHGKFNKRREVPLHKKVYDDLRSYYETERTETLRPTHPTKAFLLSSLGQRLTGYYANERIKLLALKAGITQVVSLHVLRHSIATHLLGQGMAMDQIRQFLGHSSLDTTERYVLGHNKGWRQKHSNYTKNPRKFYSFS